MKMKAIPSCVPLALKEPHDGTDEDVAADELALGLKVSNCLCDL